MKDKQAREDIITLREAIEPLKQLPGTVASVQQDLNGLGDRVETMEGGSRKYDDRLADVDRRLATLESNTAAVTETVEKYASAVNKAAADVLSQTEAAREELRKDLGVQVSAVTERVDGLDKTISGISAFYAREVPAAPEDLDKEALAGWLREVSDAGYAELRAHVLAGAIQAGYEGIVQTASIYAVYGDGSASMEDDSRILPIDADGVEVLVVACNMGRILANSVVNEIELCKTDMTDEDVFGKRKDGESESYSRRGFVARVENALGIDFYRLTKRSSRDGDRYNGQQEVGFATSGFQTRVCVVYKNQDPWGAQLAGEVDELKRGVAYGALRKQLEQGNLEGAGAIITTYFSEMKGPFATEVREMVEANPGLARYLAPLMEQD